MRDAGALAESLLSEGFAAMKIWPFDIYAPATGGQMISLSDLKAGLEPFRKIRAAVGDRIEVMCELHSLWGSPAAARICRALEDYGVFWAEDPISKMDDAQALADLRRQTRTPICGSETLGGVVPFRTLLAADALDVVMLDLAWCGGLTGGRKIAALAESYRQAAGATRLHRACDADGRLASGPARADRHLSGGRARNTGHLVSGAG